MKKLLVILMILASTIGYTAWSEFNKFDWGESIEYVKKVSSVTFLYVDSYTTENTIFLTYKGFMKDSFFCFHEINYRFDYIFINNKLDGILIAPLTAKTNITEAQELYINVIKYFEKTNNYTKKEKFYYLNDEYYTPSQFKKLKLTPQQILKYYITGSLTKHISFIIHNNKTKVNIGYSFNKYYGASGCFVHSFMITNNLK